MINKSNLLKISSLLLATSMAPLAQAVPWCHGGTIVQIADVSWTQSQIMANFSGPIPGGVADPEYYTAATATFNYAQTFAGGGGGFGGYSVPGSGQVRVRHYAPYTFTNMVGPGYYYTSQGIKFKLDKCYTIPPMTAHHELEVALPEDPDGGDIKVTPLEGLEEMPRYWRENREREQR
ncbi:hypothetical protein L2750_13010 [Shewanella submarina]|uniref:Uncharacterized protein n=1 Tax=Shewanella submarina TaxID=2016376 RepID=A0ABV7GDT3_9GAMM|nr:hypothetical protein [Shewanella submarina]MCL1038069.1 hypothetical protein [Shewanella submarina]